MAKSKVIKTVDVDKMYTIIPDFILASIENVEESNPAQYRQLSGNVSGADLIAAGCDVEWLLRSEQIIPLGWVPAP